MTDDDWTPRHNVTYNRPVRAENLYHIPGWGPPAILILVRLVHLLQFALFSASRVLMCVRVHPPTN